jgi:hypothetical protein
MRQRKYMFASLIVTVIVTAAVMLAALGGVVLAAQDKYTVQVPNGYVTASDTFTPEGNGANCGYACHTLVKAKDHIYTAYGKR